MKGRGYRYISLSFVLTNLCLDVIKNIPVAAFMIRKGTKSFLWTTEKRKDNNIKKKKNAPFNLIMVPLCNLEDWLYFISMYTHSVLAGWLFFCQHDTN